LTLFIRSIYTASFLSAIYLALLYWSDRYKRESPVSVGLAFLAGTLSVALVTITRSLLPWIFDPAIASELLSAVYRSFVEAGLVEEVAKLAFFLVVVWQFPFEDFSEEFDGMLYMGILGAGFAVYEDFIYIFQESYPPWQSGDLIRFRQVFEFMVWGRAFPGHILFGALSGYFVGKARFRRSRGERVWLFAVGTFLAVVAHGTFNMAARASSGWLIILVVGLTGILFFLRKDLLQTSPYTKLREWDEGTMLEAWKILRDWDYSHSPEDYRQLSQKDEGALNAGLIPLTLSVIILYPLIIGILFYLNRALLQLLS